MSRHSVMRALIWVSVFCLCAASTPAMSLDTHSIPPDLERWKSWVLHGQESQFCPPVYNKGEIRQCTWPSRLNLDLNAQGGRFVQHWFVFVKSWVPLPGGPENWPGNVVVDGKAVPLVGKPAVPSVYLTPGEHRIEGSFTWKEMPEMIHVPAASGLVALSINGKSVDFPLLDDSGRLWLQKREAKQSQEDRLEVRIYRRVSDTIPMQVTSLMKINVSGQSREAEIGGAFPEKAVPLSLQSLLPARFNSEGELLLQVRPGQWEIRVESRIGDLPVYKIGPSPASPYGQEIWAFQSQNHLRMVKIGGVPAVDPSQTDIPAEWKQLPAFILEPGKEMILEELRRGDPAPAPDQLHLERTWWLDFEGRGFTVRDHITGTMSRQWFLAMNPPGDLGRVSVDGVDQLITEQGSVRREARGTRGEGQDEKQEKKEPPVMKPGVELRRGQLDLMADSRMEGPSRVIPAVGWDHDFQSVSGVLNLPPGWRLLTASGVDVIPGTWFERWTLLDLFLVLIISLAIWKLQGLLRGSLALVTMILIYQETDSPQLVWLSLLAALALLRFIPEGWVRRGVNLWRWGSVVVLLALAIPFMVQQVRWGIYPQLEIPEFSPDRFVMQSTLMESDMAPPQETQEAESLADSMMKKSLGRGKSELYDGSSDEKQQYERLRQKAALAQDPNALIQTGPGLPTWKWRTISMRWNGPVDRNQQIRLWLLSPSVNLILAFLRVILLTLLIVGLIGFRQWKVGKKDLPVTVLFLCLLLFSRGADAQTVSAPADSSGNPAPSSTPGTQPFFPSSYPPADLLQQLRERLLEAPDCLPECADSPRLELNAVSESITILFDVHAAVDTAVPLPGTSKSWLPELILLDDRPAQSLSRDKDGILWMIVPEGIHRISLSGRAPSGNTFQVPLPLKPRYASVHSEGWDVQGVHPNGQVEGSLQLTRTGKNGAERSSADGITLLPFLHVERVLSLGLTWQVETVVRRMTPPGAPVVLSVPLISGESVTTAGIRAEKGMALVNMTSEANEVRWISTLETKPLIQLQAPGPLSEGKTPVSWTESWILDASPIWHCELSGIPVIHHQDETGHWRPEWRPWPGETVTIQVSRPKAVPGQLVTIDEAGLNWTPGQRFSKGDLTLQIRTSQGGQHKISLPEKAKLQSLEINAKSQPIQEQESEVMVPLQPGSQTVRVEWHQDAVSSFLIKGSKVDIGQSAVNAHVTFDMPQNRWILWTGGPRLGPAVLFWSYLIVTVLVALALGRITRTPLKTCQWLLLGLGLTQVHPLAAILIVGWLLALGARRKHTFSEGWFVFDTAQIILIFWTLAALIGLYFAIEKGLLGIPNMQIAGNGSSDFHLNWTQDRITGVMPRPRVLSLPLWVYRMLMLLWALWLAQALLKWLRWGWHCFSEGGAWRKVVLRRSKKATPPPVPGTSGGSDSVM